LNGDPGRLRGGGTNDDAAIYSAAAEAFERLFTRRVRVRKLALSAAATSPAPLQIGLFHEAGGDTREKARRVQAALDGLRRKYPAGIAPAFGRAVPALRAAGVAGSPSPEPRATRGKA
jgi:ribosomal protein S12 methylthiotransferase accessory factor YcaO